VSDIFISYGREDRERAKRLAEALQGKGWSVWWDRNIPFGKRFDDVIAEALAAAQCVIVLWTPESVRSHWVRTEAAEGAARDVLVPIRLDPDAEIPLEFKRLQTADLSDWEPGSAHQEFDLLLRRVEGLLKPDESREPHPLRTGPGVESAAKPAAVPARTPTPQPSQAASQSISRRKGPRRALAVTAFILLPTAVVAGAALILMEWRVPTPIEVDLVVNRVDLRLAASQPVPVLEERPSFRRLVIEKFSRVVFTPDSEGLIISSADAGGQTGSRRIPVAGEFVLLGDAATGAKVTLAAANDQAEAAGSIGDIWAAPNLRIIAQASRGRTLVLTTHGAPVAPVISAFGPMQVEIQNASSVPQLEALSQGKLLRLRTALHAGAPSLKIESLPEELKLSLMLPTEAPVKLLSATRLGGINVARLGAGARAESALIGEGTLTYPGYPGKESVRFAEDELPEFGGLKEAQITKLVLRPDSGTMELAFTAAEAQIVRSQSAARLKDHRLTAFDKLWYGSKMAILFAICAWVASFLFGVYKLLAK
jgi:antitoxin (DNA-binding transcriptional repressor) of toxin-antitoxin stability system